VWYFYPRRYTARSPKWSRNYDGPFLVVRVIPPADYVIQRSRRSATQVVHGDKLKHCHGDHPVSWLSGIDETAPAMDSATADTPAPRPLDSSITPDDNRLEALLDVRHPKRERRRPARLADYAT